ncbi:MAG: hypothetical protein QOG77_1346, partial [Solirubrobacteraceae bacterium]|nr:hypothetical protein [Solirubrobacteraceae bacterium]
MPRRCITAAFVLAALASFGLASSAVAAPPRLAEGSPSGLQAIYWDDHSISGDNHLHWSDRDHAYTNNGGDTSDREPQAIRFGTTMTSLAGGLRVCGYPTGGSVWAA